MINLFRNFAGREKIIDSEGDYLFGMDTSFFDENGAHYYRLPINKSIQILELEASFVLNYYIPSKCLSIYAENRYLFFRNKKLELVGNWSVGDEVFTLLTCHIIII